MKNKFSFYLVRPFYVRREDLNTNTFCGYIAIDKKDLNNPDKRNALCVRAAQKILGGLPKRNVIYEVKCQAKYKRLEEIPDEYMDDYKRPEGTI